MSTQEKIDFAFNRGDLFYKPWIGSNYDEGFIFKGQSDSVKILIIGASRYCKEVIDKGKDECENKDKCIKNCNYKDLKCISHSCKKVPQLYDINRTSIDNHITGYDLEQSYKCFENKLIEFINDSGQTVGKEYLWNHVAFVNYLQCQIGQAKTPARAKETKLFEDSKVIIEKIISILEPDVIVLWGSGTIRRNMSINPKKNNSNCSRLFSECIAEGEGGGYYSIKIKGREYYLMCTNYHPIYRKFNLDRLDSNKVVSYLKKNSAQRCSGR